MSVLTTRGTVRHRGADLAVHEGGKADGPTVLLVHGWPDTHRMWHGVAERLAPAHRVVAYDLRGFGESTDDGTLEQFRFPVPAQDLRAVVDAVSPDEPVHVLAHDWGSVITWDAVTDDANAGRIASFTSISGPNLDHAAAWVRRQVTRPSVGGTAAVLAQAASSSYVAFFVSPLAPPVFRAVATRERWQRFLQSTEGIEPSPEHHAPTLVDDMVSGLRLYRANVGGRVRAPHPRRTTVPVLQLVAERDVAIRKASVTSSWEYAAEIERRELPHGHWVPLSHPEVVAEETARFIGSVTGEPLTQPVP